MFKKKNIFTVLLGTLILFTSFISAVAEIIFQDNFDNSPDWQSNQTVNKGAGGYDIAWSNSRADECTTNCPPQGWTSYRAASSHWDDDRRKDTFILDAAGARGGTGKGITYNVEVSGHFGTWSGGSLDIWLGESGHDELYVRYYLKYDTNWTWSTPADTEHSLQKLIRVSTFNDNIWTTSKNPQYYGDTYNVPVFYPDWNHNYGLHKTYFYMSTRLGPDYTYGPNGDFRNGPGPKVGTWQCYEFYVKMNSVNGAADGVYRTWLDGELVAEATNIIWKQAGSDTSHKWNWLMLLDNVTNASASLTDHKEITVYMDDVVVSTNYIGPATDDSGTKGYIMLNAPSF